MAPDLDCLSPAHVMEGYLKKSKKWSKRYFVLREGPPPRLEYYDSYKCYTRSGKPKKVIHLKDAWNIDKKVSAKHKHLIGIYTETEYFAMAADNDAVQLSWVNALQKAVLGYKGQVNGMFSMYKHIWQGNVDTKDLENCDSTVRINLQGPHRCCLMDKTMVFIRVNGSGSSDLQQRNHVEITIASIRSCGHKDNTFFMHPGRSSGIGTGVLRMELDDAFIADNMHKTILDLWNSDQDDSRPRSYSYGSSTGRPSNNRSRHYYNPPPRQVGLGKPPSATAASKYVVYNPVSRDRCESFPATQASVLTEEARYRTSSEGETTMKRRYPFHFVRRRERGSVSPIARRGYSHGKTHLLYHQPSFLHFRTSSLPGSFTSSSNSSIEHINGSQDHSQNGQSPASSECQGSSDECSCSPFSDINAQPQFRHLIETPYCVGQCEMAPPPPTVPPETTPILTTASTISSTVQGSDYASMQPSHSRSHSLDDNLSCGTGASSLSTSPQVQPYLYSETCYLYSQSPSQSSDGGSCYASALTSPENYAVMSPGGGSDVYPHQKAPAGDHLSSDYTPMTPGRGAASSTPTEDKSGYVPMRPLARSQPQDISSSRRRSLSDNRLMNGSYSPASPLSRSPDKSNHSGKMCMKCKRELPHSFPCHCGTISVTATRVPSIPSGSIHGLKVDAKSDSSNDSNRSMQKFHNFKTSRHRDQRPMNYSDDYAIVDGLARQMTTGVGLRSSPNDIRKDQKDFAPSGESGMDNEYLPMSPMNAANSKKSVVGNVLSIVESAPKQNTSAGHVATLKYPHQHSVNQPAHYSTNSLGRESKQPRRRTKSFFGTGLSTQRHTTHPTKQDRKHSASKLTETKSNSSSTQKSTSFDPLQSRGGEYVSLSFDKARKQVGPDYVTLTETSSHVVSDAADELLSFSNHQLPGTPKATHDSNRNFLQAKQSPPKDDYTLLKPGETRELS